jgi:hypothetical protein
VGRKRKRKPKAVPTPELPDWAKKWRGKQDARHRTEVVDTPFGIVTYGAKDEQAAEPEEEEK